MIYRGKKTIAVPPGETIIEMLDNRGITRASFAGMMGTTVTRLDRLLEGTIPVSPSVASRLEQIFKVPAHFWLNLEAGYREDIANIAKENRPNGRAALSISPRD